VGRAVRALDARAYVLDAQPVVVFFHEEAGADVVRALLTAAREGRTQLRMTVVNAGEVLLVQERSGGPAASHAALDLLQALPIELVPVDLELAARAAYLKGRGGISYADCFSGALAMRDGVPLLTADLEFERIADLVEIAWL
jgi:predicted nucleic acid-binding protein